MDSPSLPLLLVMVQSMRLAILPLLGMRLRAAARVMALLVKMLLVMSVQATRSLPWLPLRLCQSEDWREGNHFSIVMV